jgi:hypothetical protein
MKLKVLLLALFAAGLAVSVAVAAPPPGKGKKDRATLASTTGATTTEPSTRGKGRSKLRTCKPTVSFVVKGTFVAATTDATGKQSFAMDVKSSNKHARALAGKQVSLAVDAQTKFRRNGRAKLADLQAGDRLIVQARACKRAPEGGTAAAEQQLIARRVNAHPATSEDSDDGDEAATSTTTTTVGTTTSAAS